MGNMEKECLYRLFCGCSERPDRAGWRFTDLLVSHHHTWSIIILASKTSSHRSDPAMLFQVTSTYSQPSPSFTRFHI